jgi:hypothetical protein
MGRRPVSGRISGLTGNTRVPRRIMPAWWEISAQFSCRDLLHWRNNHVIYWPCSTAFQFVLDFIMPLIKGAALCEEPMRLLDLNCTFTSTAFTSIGLPIIRSSDRAHMLACGSYVQTWEPVLGFTGPE